jgi:hypothetical protein
MGKIIKKRVEFGGSSNSADKIKYDDTKNVKEAIDEVNENLGSIGTYDTLLAIGTTIGSHSLTRKISDYRDIVIGLRGDTAGEAWIVPISLPSALFETFNSGFKRIIVTNGNMTCELYYVDDTTIYISAVTASRGVSIYGVK